MQTGTTLDVENYLNDCINEYLGESGNGLFNTDGKFFWSESLMGRMEKYEDLKAKRSQAGKKAMQNRWGNKQNDNKAITKVKRKIKGISKTYKKIAFDNKNNNKVITLVIKKYNKLITKNNKLNQIKSNKIKLKEIKSIYPSNHKQEENKMLEDMMDENDKYVFEEILSNAELYILNPSLAVEIKEILRELYMNPETQEKVQAINSKNLIYALKNFSIANTKNRIQKPKSYFKKCIMSALEQTELSNQFDLDTTYEQMGDL